MIDLNDISPESWTRYILAGDLEYAEQIWLVLPQIITPEGRQYLENGLRMLQQITSAETPPEGFPLEINIEKKSDINSYIEFKINYLQTYAKEEEIRERDASNGSHSERGPGEGNQNPE